MSPRGRLVLFAVGIAGFAIVLTWGALGLPDFGASISPYAELLNRVELAQRKATNVVAAIVFDYRGFDTLGEEFILFASVIGAALLLRAQREEEEAPPKDAAQHRETPRDSDAVRELNLGLVAPAFLFGLYVVLHGHLTPGGGFQGGVVLATAPLFMYLGGEYRGLRRLSPQTLIEVGEGIGAGGYAVIGVLGTLAGVAYLENVLPLGEPKRLLSAGTVPLLNLAVGLAVAAGFVLLLSEFLEQTLEVRRHSRSRGGGGA